MGKLTNLIAPSFYDIHHDIKAGNHTHYMLGGGRGSTKSSFVSVEIILGIMQNPEANGIAMRKIGVNLKDSVFEQLLWAIEALGVLEHWEVKLSPLALVYQRTGQKILFRGADNPKKIKSTKFRKGYCKYIWYEELDEFGGMEEIRTINQSLMRGGDDFCVFYSFNPPRSVRSWVNGEVLQKNPDRLTHHSTYLDVPKEWLGKQFFLEAAHLQELDETSYRHEYLGEVTGTGGMVFERVVLEEISEDRIQNFDRIYHGIDWGWIDAFAWNKMHYEPNQKTLYIFDELTLHKTANEDSARILVEEKGVTGDDLLIADSAEPKSIADYKSYGLWCKGVEKGPGSVRYRLKWLQSLKQIVIDPVRCPNTAKEFLEYEFDRDKDGTIIEVYPDGNDHQISAVSYGLYPVWKKRGE